MAFVLLLVAVTLTVYGVTQLREATRLGAEPVVDPMAAPASAPSSSARRILDERYARGEIDTDEYLHRVETLRRADASEAAPATVGAGAGDGEAAGPEQQV